VGEVSRQPDIIAELRLDERAPERSGVRLVEWAWLCQADGVGIRPDAAAPGLMARLRAVAAEFKLAWHAVLPAEEPVAAASELEAYPAALTRALNAVHRRQPRLVEPLTLNRSLGGFAHRGALYPDEFGELVSHVRWTVTPKAQVSKNSRKPDVSVVIRAKNEAAWLPRSLEALARQRVRPNEVVLVDNESSDDTVRIARRYGCRVVPISDRDFSFGRALNQGIAATTAEWVASLSAHCIPVDEGWLEALLARGCARPFLAACYGRQEPLPESSDFDKRDLWTTFGLEPRLQRGQDHFFHNANALIRRSAWARIPFDETLNGVEDRDWAKKALADGYTIRYAPQASVYHYHGIHQGRNEARAKRVVKVIELITQRPAAAEAAR
jgi:GT2 family glycosyltransferase